MANYTPAKWRVNNRDVWNGNATKSQTAITDGAILIIRAAALDDRYEKLASAQWTGREVTDQMLTDMLTSSMTIHSEHRAGIIGQIHLDSEVAVIEDSVQMVLVSSAKLSLIRTITKFDEIRINNRQNAVLFYRNRAFVAMLSVLQLQDVKLLHTGELIDGQRVYLANDEFNVFDLPNRQFVSHDVYRVSRTIQAH